jgi:hypothetical protein
MENYVWFSVSSETGKLHSALSSISGGSQWRPDAASSQWAGVAAIRKYETVTGQ